MAEVVSFVDHSAAVVNGEPVKGLIERLEGLLDAARRGEVRAIAYVTMKSHGQFATGWTDGGNLCALLGGVVRLQHGMARAWDGDE